METPRLISDELIEQVGCAGSENIEQCLLDTCDAELHKPEGEQQDVQRAFNAVRALILRLDGNTDPAVQKYLAGAVFRRAQFLAQLGRPEEARGDFKDVANSWRDSGDPDVRRIVAANWLEAGQFEEEQGNKRTAVQCYKHALAYADDPDDTTQLQVARAQRKRGEVLAALGELDEAVDVFDAAIRRWENHSEYWIRRAVANMRVFKATALKNEEYHEDAIPLFDEAIAYADRVIDPPAFFIQAGAWVSKADCLQQLERYTEALDCIDEFEQWMEHTVRPHAAHKDEAESALRRAFLVRSRCLHELARYEEALAAFDSTGVTLDDLEDEDLDTRERICGNLIRRGLILVGLERYEEAKALHHEVFTRTYNFPDPKWTVPMVMSMSHLSKCVEQRTLDPDWLTTPADGSPNPS